MNFEQLIESIEEPVIDAGALGLKIGLHRNTHKVFGPINYGFSHMTSLKGSPRIIWDNHVPGKRVFLGSYTVTGNPLVDLLGSPKFIEGTFDISFCSRLKSAKGFPDHIGGNLICHHTLLTPEELAKYDVGRKVKGNVYLEIGVPFDKFKLLKDYESFNKATGHEEQQDIGEI